MSLGIGLTGVMGIEETTRCACVGCASDGEVPVAVWKLHIHFIDLD